MNKMESSKALSHNDDSGFFFAQEMLDGDVTAAINFDRLQKHPQYGYIIFEYLLVDCIINLNKNKIKNPQWTSYVRISLLV